MFLIERLDLVYLYTLRSMRKISKIYHEILKLFQNLIQQIEFSNNSKSFSTSEETEFSLIRNVIVL